MKNRQWNGQALFFIFCRQPFGAGVWAQAKAHLGFVGHGLGHLTVIRTGGIQEFMPYAEFGWAAMHVITDDGQIIFKMSRSKKVARMEAFGGSTGKPSNIVFAIAKLRSELADESSITITKDTLLECLHLWCCTMVGFRLSWSNTRG